MRRECWAIARTLAERPAFAGSSVAETSQSVITPFRVLLNKFLHRRLHPLAADQPDNEGRGDQQNNQRVGDVADGFTKNGCPISPAQLQMSGVADVQCVARE